MMDEWKLEVLTKIRLIDHEFELRTHDIFAPPESLGHIETAEGSYPLGLPSDGKYITESDGKRTTIRAAGADGPVIAAWRIRGHDRETIAETFDPTKRQVINLIHARVAVIVLSSPLVLAKTRLVSLHYASMKPLAPPALAARANEIIASQAP